MPTLGPFFNWLRPSYWKISKHIVLGPKIKTYDDAEAFQHSWPRPHTIMSLDDSFKHGSMEGPDRTAVKNVELPFWFELQLCREQSARSVGNVTRLYNFEEREEPSNPENEEVIEDILVLQRH